MSRRRSRGGKGRGKRKGEEVPSRRMRNRRRKMKGRLGKGGWGSQMENNFSLHENSNLQNKRFLLYACDSGAPEPKYTQMKPKKFEGGRRRMRRM